MERRVEDCDMANVRLYDASGCGDAVETGLIVQGCELGDLGYGRLHLGIDHDRRHESIRAMHDPVADEVDGDERNRGRS